jgi:hypothetical protein
MEQTKEHNNINPLNDYIRTTLNKTKFSYNLEKKKFENFDNNTTNSLVFNNMNNNSNTINNEKK